MGNAPFLPLSPKRKSTKCAGGGRNETETKDAHGHRDSVDHRVHRHGDHHLYDGGIRFARRRGCLHGGARQPLCDAPRRQSPRRDHHDADHRDELVGSHARGGGSRAGDRPYRRAARRAHGSVRTTRRQLCGEHPPPCRLGSAHAPLVQGGEFFRRAAYLGRL